MNSSSIIILARDKADLTRRCLEALICAGLPDGSEILLVDNGSGDGTPRLLQEFSGRFGDLRYLRNEQNLSYSKANNKAAALARGSRLLFLNNDVFVQPGSIDALLEAMREPKAGAAGGKLLYPDSKLIQHAGIRQMLWGYVSNYGVCARPSDARFNTLQEIFAVTGAMLCIEKSLFTELGGFDEGFWYGYEDVDLCLKIRKAGLRVLYVPQAVALHHESATPRDAGHETTFEANYRRYRRRWNTALVPKEQEYLGNIRNQGIRRVSIFGTGRAAVGLFRSLVNGGIEVTVFLSPTEPGAATHIHERPVMSLEEIPGVAFGRICVGSQYFFQLEELLASCDPKRSPIFPVVS